MKVKINKRETIEVNETALDKIVNYFSPVRGQRRLKARVMSAVAGAYMGGSKTRRNTEGWTVKGGSPDADLLADHSTLIERSRDLIRNNPLAAGAINTKVTNVIGPGLKLQARIDRDVLPLDDDQADAWEQNTEREFKLFFDNQEVDAARTLDGDAITRLVYRQAKENGDVLVLFPRFKRSGSPYTLKLQVVEADRLVNDQYTRDTDELRGGVKMDQYGAPEEYHILKKHPGADYGTFNREWDKIPAFGAKTGLRNVLHIYKMLRPGQTRGVPDLAAVIEPLKQLGRYTEAELMATVVSSFFTVFVKTPAGGNDLGVMAPSEEIGGKTTDEAYKLGQGAMIGLGPEEEIQTANPGRPNPSFDPFVQAVLRQVGVALELPFEMLIKHFTASYSAARAALLEAWKYFSTERAWITKSFNSQVYKMFMYEAVATGRISAPGFFTNPLIQRAYLGAEWIGPAKGMIDEKKEIEAAKTRVEMGVSTLAEVTAELTGGDWQAKHPQRVKENNKRKEDGLKEEKTAAPAQAPAQDPPPANNNDDGNGGDLEK